MNQKLLLTGVLALAFSLPAAAAEDSGGPKTFSAEHVFDLEYGDDPQVSPDGDTIMSPCTGRPSPQKSSATLPRAT